MAGIINEVISCVFLDNFYFSAFMITVLAILLAVSRWSSQMVPDKLVLATWWFLVLGGIAVSAWLIVQFFSYPQGVDRLAVIVVFLGAAPLFIAALLAIFVLRPRKIF